MRSARSTPHAAATRRSSADLSLLLWSIDHRPSAIGHRRGFTLVELLVAIAILIILTTLVIAAFRRDDGDRLNGSARLLQSYFEGARSRAISDDKPRGVRLIVSASDSGVVDSVAYIGSPGFDTGTVDIGRQTPSGGGDAKWLIRNDLPLKWARLARTSAVAEGRNLIYPGLRIEFYETDPGNWYVISETDFDTLIPQGMFYIEGHLAASSAVPGGDYAATPRDDVAYRLELAPTILPNTEPVQLERGIVIDLDASQIPNGWWSNPGQMDFLFDGRGSPTGSVVASGLVHLYVTSYADVELTRGQDPTHPGNGVTSRPAGLFVPARAPIVPQFEPYVLTLFTQAGQITMSRVDATDADDDGWADDPFSYARRGREAQ